jgi:hypothetical protein
MATLRELESLKAIVEVQKQEICDLKQEILDINIVVSELVKNDKILINKSSCSKEINNNNNNDLSIIFCKYKQSLIVKNKYTDKNTTIKCKNELKELGAKWFKNELTQGWIFVGICKDNDKSLEEVSKFIVDSLSYENKFNLEIEYE